MSADKPSLGLGHSDSADEPTVIDAEEFAEAQRDPKFHALLADVDRLSDDLVARGHCRCHLVINCPDAENA